MRNTLDDLLPKTISYSRLPGHAWNKAVLLVDGVAISLTFELRDLRIVVQTDRASELILRFLDEMRSRADAVGDGRCVLEPL